MKLRFIIISLISTLFSPAYAAKLFIPMSAKGQENHLKAYGVAFAAIRDGIAVDWLLNYKGGSFVMDYDNKIALLCKQRNVTCKKISNADYEHVVKTVIKRDFNMDVVKLTKVPRIAVYTPANKGPWDDAVTLAMTYAEIPFDKLYVDEVLAGDLDKYDWLHLHHEDFTGQQGKFYGNFHATDWYKQSEAAALKLVSKHGFKKISQMQLAVVKKIRDFVANGGNMFAMCSATDTYDIALAADGTDICDSLFDGDPMDKNAQAKLDYSKCFAFKDFSLVTNPFEYEYADIDNSEKRRVLMTSDSFTLYPQAAKFDPVPSMLCQNHTTLIKGFMGQTTGFQKSKLKTNVLVMADLWTVFEARYIHGEYGRGSFTFYGGHDPEDYMHNLHDSVTDLNRFPSSPGYRLILNNVLFPAAKKKILPTVMYNTGKQETAPVPPPAQADNVPLEKRVKMFPNPSSGELVITITPDKIDEVVIIDAGGKEVFRKKYGSDKAAVDMNLLMPGLYLIQVNGEYAGKVMKN
jgi:hypothetical protein